MCSFTLATAVDAVSSMSFVRVVDVRRVGALYSPGLGAAGSVPGRSLFARSLPRLPPATRVSPNGGLAASSVVERRTSGDGGVCTARVAVGVGSSFVVREGGVAAESAVSAAVSEISLGETNIKGESYFLTDTRPIILFDGVCNMCNGGVNFVLDNDAEGRLRFAALQSGAGRALLVRSGRSPDDITSVVLVDKDRSYIKSEAVLRTAQYLGFPFPPAAFLAFAIPLFLRDIVYDTVADNRYTVFGQTNMCRVSDPRFGERFVE